MPPFAMSHKERETLQTLAGQRDPAKAAVTKAEFDALKALLDAALARIAKLEAAA
jgi:hypothetical protein